MPLVSEQAAIGATYGALAFFFLTTLLFGYKQLGKDLDPDKYMSARNSQKAFALAMSFFASNAGAWILFAVPEAAILGGPIALLGYAIASVVPLLLFSLITPALRNNLPRGITFFEMVHERYGWAVNVYVTLCACFYMYLYLAAEFTSVGSAVGLLSGTGTGTPGSALAAIIGTSVVTLLYTGIGGLPVSLLTDRVQGIGALTFAVLVCVAAFSYTLFPKPPTEAEAFAENTTSYNITLMQHENWQMVTAFGISDNVGESFKMFFVLMIAVTSANMLHSGFQQRIWAACDNTSAKHGLYAASILTVPFILLFGVLGMIAFAKFGFSGLISPAYIPFLSAFLLIQEGPQGWQVVAIILAVMMVASSADTIQTGFTAVLSPAMEKIFKFLDVKKKFSRPVWRCLNFFITAAINVPAIILATQNLSVLTLFVLADLLCATCVCPVLMGLSPRIHPTSALADCIAGLLTALLVFGIGFSGEKGIYITLFSPGGLYSDSSLLAFCLTPTVSIAATLLVNIPYRISGYHFAGYNHPSKDQTSSDV